MADATDTDAVRHIAMLGRLALTDEQLEKMAVELSSILGFVGKLQQLDTSNVEPMTHTVEIHNVLAEDKPSQSLSPSQALTNAPARDGDFFKVPKVLGKN